MKFLKNLLRSFSAPPNENPTEVYVPLIEGGWTWVSWDYYISTEKFWEENGALNEFWAVVFDDNGKIRPVVEFWSEQDADFGFAIFPLFHMKSTAEAFKALRELHFSKKIAKKKNMTIRVVPGDVPYFSKVMHSLDSVKNDIDSQIVMAVVWPVYDSLNSSEMGMIDIVDKLFVD